MGAPNLTDKIWLHGYGEEAITAMVLTATMRMSTAAARTGTSTIAGSRERATTR